MEVWDLYNENYELTGESVTRGNPIPENRYHLVIHFWLINSKGEHLIQKRSPLVTSGSGKWAITGGSAQAGESSRDAVIREINEEIGYIVDNEDELIKFSSKLRGTFILDTWYLKKDIPIEVFQVGEEVSDVRYAGKNEIHSLIESGDFWEYHERYIDKMFELANS